MEFDRIPCDPKASRKAKELLEYLADTAGKKLIAGQHTQTKPMEERARIHELTGRYPKLVGFELLSLSPNINYADASDECLTEVYENRGTLDTALRLADRGDIILSMCFHWFSPIGGRDKSFYSEHTDFDPTSIFTDPEAERAFYSDLDVIAKELQIFQEHDIPILWRPFHESEGTWFWWGRKGPEIARDLYIRMYTYFTQEKNLHNLLWVWSSAAPGAYPGDEYVDVVGWDIYLQKKTYTDYSDYYEKLTEYTSERKVHALTEIGYLPDAQMLLENQVPWAYFMTWSKEFILTEQFNTAEDIQRVYSTDGVITVDGHS